MSGFYALLRLFSFKVRTIVAYVRDVLEGWILGGG